MLKSLAEDVKKVTPWKTCMSTNDTLIVILVDTRYNKHLETEYQDIEFPARGHINSNAIK